MPILKLKTALPHSDEGALHMAASARAAPSPTPSTAGGGGGGTKLKLNFSQPPTPATEQPASTLGALPGANKKKPAQRKPANGAASKGSAGQKRPAKEDISPLPKRLAGDSQPVRKPLLKLKNPTPSYTGVETTTPLTAGGLNKIKFGGARKPSEVKRPTLIARRKVPDRPKGVGYDSEDSEREEDPAIQQGLILRMQPGGDADALRAAIANGKIGVKEQDGVNASLKFLTTDLRRAVVKVGPRMYAAALVDLPCIVESMKSWDKKGWWKVADVSQMLLVLGPVKSEDEVKNYSLPGEVDKSTMQYAHGLTPPMHHVRKRRFRKRAGYQESTNVEDEVERLLRDDKEWERNRDAVIQVQEYTQGEWERLQNEPEPGQEEEYNDELDADGEPMDSTEWDPQQQQDLEGDDDNLEAELQDAMAEDMFGEPGPAAADLMTDSPIPMAEQAASMSAVEYTMADDSAAETPAATPRGDGQDPTLTQDEQSSDEDESDYDDDEDSPAVVDEDAAARAAERTQQLEEVDDLQREIESAEEKITKITNQLLKRRETEKLGKLKEDWKMKRLAFGLDED
ncbi:hypothetical protein LTR36_002676 [Oleoguttula mirabilis]|uniref:TAFII55 protein conserved region domain-containing protein n=1 Tax=Oleoguttula mirabilis TaxID=1507867 RepID=A0AAV9JK85_9PEZI|nr:hypothetical protein LTR36_002676 [Oleoguttula mirabilis]